MTTPASPLRHTLSTLFVAAALATVGAGCSTDVLDGRLFACDSADACAAGHFCDAGGVCRPTSERGVFCTTSDDCSTGVICSPNGTCGGMVVPPDADIADTTGPDDTDATADAPGDADASMDDSNTPDSTADTVADTDVADTDTLADADADADMMTCSLTVCGELCVDTSQDANHCGACDAACQAPPGTALSLCVDGQCSPTCEPTHADCNADPRDGCEMPWRDCGLLVSLSTGGDKADDDAIGPSLSSTGRYAVFASTATNLAGSTNGFDDVYLRDLASGTTELISLPGADVDSDNHSRQPVVSRDGQVVAFRSRANLVALDTDDIDDVYVRDLAGDTTSLVSVSSEGTKANGTSRGPALTPDGRYVVFETVANNLDPADVNVEYDIYLRDLQSGTTTLVSKRPGGATAVAGNHDSYAAAVTADARYVVFESLATNFLALDTDVERDIYRVDLTTGAMILASVDDDGVKSNGEAYRPDVSDDGRYVVFHSNATNLSPLDTDAGFDVYLHDTMSGTTTLLSLGLAADNTKLVGDSTEATISADGSRVAFLSEVALVADDTNGLVDVYVYDRVAERVALVSVSQGGVPSDADIASASIADDGRAVIFATTATTLDARDTDALSDVFVVPVPRFVAEP